MKKTFKENQLKKYWYTIKFLLVPLLINGGRGLFICGTLLGLVVIPLNSFVDINTKQIIVDAISNGEPWSKILLTIIVLQALLTFTTIVEPCYTGFYADRKKAEVSARINLAVYRQALRTDLKYFDDPKFYDKYTYAINAFSEKCFAMESLIRGMIINITVISMLITLISTTSPLLILVSVVTLVVNTWLGTKNNHVIQEKNISLVSPDREIGYIHRLFYLKEWAAGLKCTPVSNTLIDRYSTAIKVKTPYTKNIIPSQF